MREKFRSILLDISGKIRIFISKIIPNQNIELISSISKSEVYNIFNENIEYIDKMRIIGMRHDSFRDFEGHIKNDNFTFRRILKSGANSYIPIITGKITETQNGVEIHLNAKLHKTIERFIIGFDLFLFFNFLLALTNIDFQWGTYNSIYHILGIAIMFFLSFTTTMLVFSFEVYRIEKHFRRILCCENKPGKNDNKFNRKLEKIFYGI